MSKTLKVFFLCFLLIITLGVGGVYATWYYANTDVDSVKTGLGVYLQPIQWEGSDELPTDADGENHYNLVQRLVSGTSGNTVIGLNNSNSQLSTYVKNRVNNGYADYFGSVAVTGGSEMSQLFDASTNNITFFIEHISNTEYYIYTTSVYLGERGKSQWQWFQLVNTQAGNPSIPIEEWVYAVYKTKLTRASSSREWTIAQTWTGRAKSDWYDENQNKAYQNVTQIPAVDLDTWQEYTMGSAMNKNEAIWTFVGDNGAMHTKTPENPVYYQITPKRAQTITITTNAVNAEFTIYNASGTQIARAVWIDNWETVGGKEVLRVSWSASANTLYYIEMAGCASIPFSVA